VKRFFLLASILMSVPAPVSAGTIPITGTIRFADGTPMQGRVRFTLSQPAFDMVDSTLIVSQPVEFSVTNGRFPSGARIVPNDTLRPENTHYVVEYFNASGRKLMENTFVIHGSTFNIGSAIPISTTTSDVSFSSFNGPTSLSLQRINNIRMCDQFPGANAGAKIAACIADLPATGGTADARGFEGAQTIARDIFNGAVKPVTLLLGATTFIWTAPFSPSSGSAIIGSGMNSTDIIYSGPGAWLDTSPSASVNNVRVTDLHIHVDSPALGAIRVGRTSEAFGTARVGWNFKNLYITGPGYPGVTTLPAGSFGLSISQMLDSLAENLNILGFERASFIDRCGNNQWNRVRWQQYKFGPLISSKAGSGSASGGGSQDTFIEPEFLGPTSVTTGGRGVAGTDYGYTVEVQAQQVTFINALYEPGPFKSQGLLHLEPVNPGDGYSTGFVDINGAFGGPSDNTIVFESGYNQPTFIGSRVGAPGWGAISFGTPYASQTSSKARFIGVNGNFSALVAAADPTGAKSLLDLKASTRATTLDLTSLTITGDIQTNKRFIIGTETDITGGTTPDVSSTNRLLLYNPVTPVSITDFINGVDGQVLYLWFGGANTTLVNSGSVRLKGLVNFVSSAGDDTMTLIRMQGSWFELSRSVN